MAKGKTAFVCVERKICAGQWRWAVTLLGECLASGTVKTQQECRIEKDRVKREFLERNKPTEKQAIAAAKYSGDWRKWDKPRSAPRPVA